MSRNLTGMKFGRWTAMQIERKGGTGKHTHWLCQCACGTIKGVSSDSLTCGTSKSCGCLTRETVGKRSFKHGHSTPRTPTYFTWKSMLSRCNNPKARGYKRYGGRGIAVCREWADFCNFLTDMGEKPKGLELDRINNELGYFKDNCRWVTPKENCRNTRRNRIIEYNGQLKPLCEWGELLGLRVGTIRARLARGWNIKKALTLPKQKRLESCV